MNQTIEESHSTLLENIKASRERRKTYFDLSSGSLVPVIVVLLTIAVTLYYLKGIVSQTQAPARKLSAGGKTVGLGGMVPEVTEEVKTAKFRSC